MNLSKEETKLTGGFKNNNGSLVEDETTIRINWLIKNQLKKLATDSSGWFVLFEDPSDKRYWELSYPDSEDHGGGMPVLANLTSEEANKKYNLKSPL